MRADIVAENKKNNNFQRKKQKSGKLIWRKEERQIGISVAEMNKTVISNK